MSYSVGLCHGTFDFLHYGHLLFLKYCASKCNHLVVSVTADAFVRKGAGRPLFNQSQRFEMLNAMDCVDEVYICESDTGIPAIERFTPNFYFKGVDYLGFTDPTGRLDAERVAIESIGGELVLGVTEKFSSTELMQRLKLIDG